ncbi:MAG: ArgE/DapE family deacylase [Solirubrobacterales bacterium]|nr:ArgE/DapE family deacylase [Solirubrobacterales bacterium]
MTLLPLSTHDAIVAAPLTALSNGERRVCEHLASREAEIVELLRALVGFDTVTHVTGARPRQEAQLQALVARRLEAAGADVEVAEPDPALVAGHATVPEGFDFAGRPQLVARFRGTGTGRTLLLNGHVDVVDVEPRHAWSHDPFDAVVRDGAVWGRGAADMKGGVASMVVAAQALAELDVPLAGDLVVNTVTEEESSGIGGLVSARTIAADAAIVPEPSGLGVWVACRGSLLAAIAVEGRAGHAGILPRHHTRGGAVNAIEKMAYLLEAIGRLREDWAQRSRHPYLPPANCVPTGVSGGEWFVSYPSACVLECHLQYPPGHADEHGGGTLVMREFEETIARAAAADPWLREHPPRVSWRGGVPPAEVSPQEPVAQTLLAVERNLGRPERLGGLENWHDGATLIFEAGMPAVCYGPGDIHRAHTVDEHVPVSELVWCAQGIAVAAMRFCGLT